MCAATRDRYGSSPSDPDQRCTASRCTAPGNDAFCLRRCRARVANHSAKRRANRPCASGRRQERHGGGAGGDCGAHRRRHFAARRQCGGCRGRRRLCARRDLSARRQSRRRRFHADPPGVRQRYRDRLSRDRAGGDHEQNLSRCGRQRRSAKIARLRARHRRAGHGRGSRLRGAALRLGPVHARRPDRAGAQAGARRHAGDRRHRGYVGQRAGAAQALAVHGKNLSQTRRHGARAWRFSGAKRSGQYARSHRQGRAARVL